MFDRLQLINTALLCTLIAFVHWQIAFACAMDFLNAEGKRFADNKLALYFATLFTAAVTPFLLLLLGATYVVCAPYFLTRWLLRHL